MKIQSPIYLALLLLFSSVTSAAILDTEPGYPRLVDNDTKIKSKYKGIVAEFEATNKFYQRNSKQQGNGFDKNLGGMDPYFKATEGTPRNYIGSPTFYTWANIRAVDDTLEVLDGMFEAHGSLELNGNTYEGLMFSASILDVAWDSLTIKFEMGSDHSGYLCDLGYCTFVNELLQFNLTSGLFDGDFTSNFNLDAQTVATVPVPAAVWLFGSALLGLSGLKKKKSA